MSARMYELELAHATRTTAQSTRSSVDMGARAPCEISAAEIAKACSGAKFNGSTDKGSEWWFRSRKLLLRTCSAAARVADL